MFPAPADSSHCYNTLRRWIECRVALKNVVTIVTFWLTASQNTFAHPEGFSGLHITIEGGQLSAALTLHTRDLGAWFSPGRFPDYVPDVCRELERTIDEVIEVQLDGIPLDVADKKAFLLEVGLIQLDITWELPASTDLREVLIWSKHLYLLPRGHQQLLFVEDRREAHSKDDAGQILLEDILTIERDAGTTDLPADKVTASAEPPQAQSTPSTSPSIAQEETGSTAASTQHTQRTPSLHSDGQPSHRISFFKLGVEHILTGYDHLLFLAALLLTCEKLSVAAKIITCFTIAHSITLALAALELVQLPAGIVEPAIALSIVYVAVENLFTTPTLWRRVTVTFVFGLIHGLGFASVLRDIGLGSLPGGVTWPLLRFNLGVEAGQLCVAILLLQVLNYSRKNEGFHHRLVRYGSLLISLCGGYWLIARIVSQLYAP